MFLTPGSGGGTLRFAVTTNGSGAEQQLNAAPLPASQWVHLAVSRNGTLGKLYTNGVLAASGSLTIPPAAFNPALNYLGKSQWPDPLFSGQLDEVYVYNYALSDTEVSRLTTNLPPPPASPTTLLPTRGPNLLGLSWPSTYLGSRLESNSVGFTATSSWFAIPGSASTNGVFVPLDASRSNVFFRLIYP